MGEGALEPINRAFRARISGRMPSARDLDVCRKHSGQDLERQLQCWNGGVRRIAGRRVDCGHYGSGNIPWYAHVALNRVSHCGALCRVEEAEGIFGREIGSDAEYYYGGVFDAKRWAMRELASRGDEAAAAVVRRVLRAALAWDAIAALPVARLLDVAIFAGDREGYTAEKDDPHVCVAVSGNRYTPKVRKRRGLSTDNSHSLTLAEQLGLADARPGLPLVLSADEVRIATACLDGNVDAAREVASWMLGTIDFPAVDEVPDVRWRFRLRRTTEGAESVWLGPWPNPHKPSRTVGQVFHDGTMRSMSPAPNRGAKWGSGKYHVEISGGEINATCGTGEAVVAELGGEVLWQVDVVGQDVRFTAGAA